MYARHSEQYRLAPAEAVLCAACLFSWCCQGECIQWTGGCVEMPMREMQINRGLFQIAMSEQHLDGAQIGTGFEQVRGKAMP